MKVQLLPLFTPKNSRLECCRDIAKEIANRSKAKIIEMRGEDIPFFCNEMIKQGKKVIGILSEDLFEEFRIGNPYNKLSLIQRIPWPYEGLFGKPTLCLLGPANKRFKDMQKILE